jgi:hypothetical protein
MPNVFLLAREQVIVTVCAKLRAGCTWLVARAFAFAGLTRGAGDSGSLPVLLSHAASFACLNHAERSFED